MKHEKEILSRYQEYIKYSQHLIARHPFRVKLIAEELVNDAILKVQDVSDFDHLKFLDYIQSSFYKELSETPQVSFSDKVELAKSKKVVEINPTTLVCRKCHQIRLIDDFYKWKKGHNSGYELACKICRRETKKRKPGTVRRYDTEAVKQLKKKYADELRDWYVVQKINNSAKRKGVKPDLSPQSIQNKRQEMLLRRSGKLLVRVRNKGDYYQLKTGEIYYLPYGGKPIQANVLPYKIKNNYVKTTNRPYTPRKVKKDPIFPKEKLQKIRNTLKKKKAWDQLSRECGYTINTCRTILNGRYHNQKIIDTALNIINQ